MWGGLRKLAGEGDGIDEQLIRRRQQELDHSRLRWKPGGHKGKRNAGSRQRQSESSLVAAQMHAVLAGANDEDAEALRRRWREQVIAGYEGYVTAASGCGVIAFNERDEILLIQRPTGKWWYPTGFCDVGVSPAE